jgi:hypothetical protein
LDASLDAAQISFRRSQILLAGKEQSHIHWHTGKDRLLDRLNASGSTGNLDEKVGPLGPSAKPPDFGDCAWYVVGRIGETSIET